MSLAEQVTHKHNFNAGPSILPREVFEEASRAILNFNDTGVLLHIQCVFYRIPTFPGEEGRLIGS